MKLIHHGPRQAGDRLNGCGGRAPSRLVGAHRFLYRTYAVPLVLAGAIALAGGCGGGGGSPSVGAPPDTITAANQSGFTSDATILASRAATGPWITASTAGSFDQDLAAIRARFSAVSAVHARPAASLTDVGVVVSSSAPWILNWKSGNMTTGESGLDSLLRQYDVTSVHDVGPTPGGETFQVNFGQPMNPPAAASSIKSASSNILSAAPDTLGGDGDQITFQTSGGGKVYTFSHGWGDCAAGCTSRHNWQITIAPDGSMTETESGTPLP